MHAGGENMFLRDFARLRDSDQSGFRSRFGDLETSLSVNWSIHTIYIKLNPHQAVLNRTIQMQHVGKHVYQPIHIMGLV